MFIVRTLCLSISTLCTILAIFIPKIRAVSGVVDSSASDSSGSSHKIGSTPSIIGASERGTDFSLTSVRSRSKGSRDNTFRQGGGSVTSLTIAEETDLLAKIKKLKKENKDLRKQLLAASEQLQGLRAPARDTNGDESV